MRWICVLLFGLDDHTLSLSHGPDDGVSVWDLATRTASHLP
jgi:hypothetical protein